MKKHLFFVIGTILSLFSGTMLAQDKSDAVKKLAQSLRSHKNVEVSFTYQTTDGSDPADKAKQGKAYFQDNAYKVVMEDQHAISDGKTTWHYIIEDEEVMVGNATDDDNPYKVLDKLERDNSGLTPVIDSKGNLKKLEVEMDEGNKMVLNIIDMKFDQNFEKDFFIFDQKKHPNVEIIDMR